MFGITSDTDKTKDETTQNKAQTITQSPTPTTPTPTTPTPTTPTPTTTQPTPSTPKYTYDIPALLGKNIDEIRSVLGDPDNKERIEPTEEQKKIGIDIWDNMYTKNNQELLITFNPVDRKIIDFFLSGENKSQLLKNGNVSENDSNYKIEDVKDMSDSSKITGIKIIPR